MYNKDKQSKSPVGVPNTAQLSAKEVEADAENIDEQTYENTAVLGKLYNIILSYNALIYTVKLPIEFMSSLHINCCS